MIKVVPRVSTINSMISAFSDDYEARRGEKLPEEVVAAVEAHLKGDMLINGLVQDDESLARDFTDADGHRALATAVMSHSFGTLSTVTRFQLLAWMAFAEQTGFRASAVMAHKTLYPGYLTFGHVTYVVTKNGPRNSISVVVRPSHDKTGSGLHAELVLMPMPDPYRDPAFLFILLATRHGALEHSYAEMVDPAFLLGDTREVSHKTDRRKWPVFETPVYRSDTFVPPEPWQYSGLRDGLFQASLIAGFKRPAVPHVWRRSRAVFAKLSGDSRAEIQMKLAHKYKSQTHVYHGMVL